MFVGLPGPPSANPLELHNSVQCVNARVVAVPERGKVHDTYSRFDTAAALTDGQTEMLQQ